MRCFYWLVMILCGTVSLAGTIDPNTPDSKYVEYGSKFNFIHKICGTYQDNGLYCASCVIIDKNWAITAAHVVKGAQLCFISQADKVYAVDKIIYHELYKEDQYGYHDIALCHSSSDIKLDFYPELYTEKDEINKICCISGYGLTGTFLTGIKTGDDKRRAGSNKIEYIDRHLLICTPSKTNRTELEFLIGSGDSGGGLFIDGKLAGINSCVLSDDGKPDSTYTDESGHTRVSLYNEWIKSNIKSYTQEILAQSDEKKK